jgi:hypothetical protein
MNHFISGLHIKIRNCSRYSCSRTSEHSKNFSNPQAAKGPRTTVSSSLTASLRHAQSLSLQWTGIINWFPASTYIVLDQRSQPIKTPKSPKKISFYTPQLCLKGSTIFPIGAHICAPVHPTVVHSCTTISDIGAHACTLVTQIDVHSSTPVCYTVAHTSTTVRNTVVHACTTVLQTGTHPMHACFPHPSTPMCDCPTYIHALMCMNHSIVHALRGSLSQIPPVRPSV